MNRIVYAPFLAWVLFGLAIGVNAQFRPFEKYRFEDGGYSVAGVFEHHDDHPLQKKLGEFYTDDLAVLNALKKSWIFARPQNQHACGYHYLISILRNGVILDDFAINLDCHELALGDRSFYFDSKKLEDFASRFRPLYRVHNEFTSIALARDFWKESHSNTDFVYAWKPEWLEFEGEFQFRVQCTKAVPDCFTNGNKMLPDLKDEIAAAYPNETFELKTGGGSSSGEMFVLIKCNESLEKRFDLHDRWDKQGFGEWQSYRLTLDSYWKHPPKLNK